MKKIYTIFIVTILAIPSFVFAQNAQVNSTVGGTTTITTPAVDAEGNVDVDTSAEVDNDGTLEDDDDDDDENMIQIKGSTNSQAQMNTKQRNESDLEFLQKNRVRAQAQEVRGWDTEQKQQFMAAVKTWAQVRSGQDLEHFAQGVILENEHAQEVEVDDDQIKVRFRQPAKFLGVFDSNIDQEAVITFGDGEHGRVPQEVKVKFPWYRIFYQIDQELHADTIQNEIATALAAETEADMEGDEALVDAQGASTFTAYAKVLDMLNTTMKTRLQAATEAEVQ